MMAELHILNTKQIKQFKKIVKDQWGADFGDKYHVLKHPNGRTYIVNKEIDKIDLDNLRISTVGLYFATWNAKGFRLSIEGSQIIGSSAKKNVLELDSKQTNQWLLGQELELPKKQQIETKGYVIVKHKKDYMGSGKIAGGRLLNYVPKTRRIGAVIE
jgi:NOL1/NOP2/fmu family ribosome biogenesis protein